MRQFDQENAALRRDEISGVEEKKQVSRK